MKGKRIPGSGRTSADGGYVFRSFSLPEKRWERGTMARAESTAAFEAKCLTAAEKMGFELVDVCIDKEPAGKYLRIFIDKPSWFKISYRS